MEEILAKLCGTSPIDPLPVWVHCNVGHCFNQLFLNIVPHAILAVISACYIGIPRSFNFGNVYRPGWKYRIAASFLLAGLFILDIIPVAIWRQELDSLYLEILTSGIATLAWLTHCLALFVLYKSPYSFGRGPALLLILVFFPIPSLIITLVWHFQTEMNGQHLQPVTIFRVSIICLQLASLLLYVIGYIIPVAYRQDFGAINDNWQHEPLITDSGISAPIWQGVAEDGESWLSRFSYAWMNPLMKRGYQWMLNRPQDVCQLPQQLRTARVRERFYFCWQKKAALIQADGETTSSTSDLMTEFLFGMRVIKFYTWEQHFGTKVYACRTKELKSLRAIKYLDAVCVYLWAALPVVVSISIFITYVLLGHQLSAAKVFTALALVGMLILPLNNFPWVLNGILEAKVSLDRIQHFLELSDQNLDTYYSRAGPSDPSSALEMHHSTFSWSPASQGNAEQQLTRGSLQLSIQDLLVAKGTLVGVVGKVGCGKSTLLAAITGELSSSGDLVYVWNLEKGFGLASQEPWIQFTSIRENILFGKEYDARFYQKVVEACALSDDLNILPAGDQTEVGENGVTLSGGQKARVALARAVYQEKEIYLLDDPLAAVDADVANHLMQKCILGILKHKTRILCTHRTEFLGKADILLLMDNGKILKTGTPSEILPLVEAAPELRETDKRRKDKIPTEYSQEEDVEPEEEETNQANCLLNREEEKKEGAVAFQVYKVYWLAIGSCLAFSILLSLLLMQASRNISDWWLSNWISSLPRAENTSVRNLSALPSSQLLLFSHGGLISPVMASTPSNGSLDVNFYLTVYGSIAGANSVFTILRAFLFAYGTIHAATIIHTRLLRRVMKATMTFFDTTPTGRILNRFSSDMYCVDDSLPFLLNIFLANVFGLLGMLVMITYGLPWIGLVLLPLAAIYYSIQSYYRRTSRELKRLYSLTLSPIYTHFSETLTGLSTIRATRATERFETENQLRLELNQRCRFASNTAMQWLDIRLQMIGVAVVTAIAGIAIIQHQRKLGDPGLVGLALSYALSVTNLLSGLISSFTQTETMMVSVERTEEYSTDIPIELQDELIQVAPDWPSQGHIEFQQVVLAYRPDLPNALDGVTFTIYHGEKIGIVGRTGSGKSTLFLALFRMVELRAGQILLDNINSCSVGLKKLRSRMAIIPQDPFLFSGTVRENLDPQGQYTDADLYQVLEQCHLQEVVTEMGGLDRELGERGKSLSVGQRQLVCLARALLTQAKVLCIDEATASVDQKTDRLLQQTIRQQFADKTVLTIAHRLNTILDSDRVLVMHAGKVAELDSPDVLSKKQDSLFQHLLHSGQQ
ncbi:ATP-binding cassette sub-family C member 10 isoform X2 [Hemicordylus capensis]|uniref:ATP-binding cassette sub-family C member 10 isoform X2 n=1 Tax=Hemicordylus capensis TaxID=884348 RepID=UPI0023040D1E|nr:ATP-binding cassette sub-family C member 10 isoform X2 [Hemicordylus capensis]